MRALTFLLRKEFLQILRGYGRQAADDFLARHFDMLGRESTLDIQRYL